MREKTFHVYVDSHDRSLLLQSLVELKIEKSADPARPIYGLCR